MKKIISLFLITVLFISCKNKSGYKKAEDAQDAGREFIRASLDGDYNKARFYLLNDSINTNGMILEKWKKDYNQLAEEEKVNYREATIIVLKVEPVNDSIENFMYTNSYEVKDTTTIKIVKVNGEWLVDLKDIH